MTSNLDGSGHKGLPDLIAVPLPLALFLSQTKGSSAAVGVLLFDNLLSFANTCTRYNMYFCCRQTMVNTLKQKDFAGRINMAQTSSTNYVNAFRERGVGPCGRGIQRRYTLPLYE